MLIHFFVQVSLTLACPMNLKLFPLDTQTCHLTIASYGWTARDLEYQWKVSKTENGIIKVSCFLSFAASNQFSFATPHADNGSVTMLSPETRETSVMTCMTLTVRPLFMICILYHAVHHQSAVR